MNSTSQNYLLNLNNQQKEAVIHTDGPLLILAGAGSGKTKVLTTRVVHLIETKKCWANQILCVTFTNKAANEMRERILKLLSAQSSSLPWLGTFHSISNKILRRHAEAVGLKSNFTILDTLDQLRLIKNIIESENIDIKKIPPKLVAAFIDDWKNKGLIPSEVKVNNENYIKDTALKIYKIYQQRLKIMNCVDFGDLILHCVTIFKTMPEILELYHNNFKYILVDEYQDTNFIQNIWLNLLSKKNNNLCCVGDDDQSIYSWRGAEVKNILNFDKLNANTKVIKLEQNYRSTQNILDTASSLISNNEDRLGKKLWSENSKGDLIEVNCYNNGYDEAIAVADEIEKNLSKEHISHYITRLLGEEITVNDEDNIIIKFDDGYLMDTLDFRDSESKYDDDDNDTDYNINDDYNNDDYTHDDDFNIEDENDDYNHDDDDDDSTEVITYNQNNLQCKKRIIIGPRLYYPTNCIDHFIVNKHLFQYRIPNDDTLLTVKYSNTPLLG